MTGVLATFLLSAPLLGLQLTPPADGLASSAPVMWEASIASAASAYVLSPEEGSPEETSTLADRRALAQRREHLRGLHRGFGIASWVMWTATVVFGYFQYSDRYGWFGDHDDTPCNRGQAQFGDWQCDVPILHISAAVVTAGLYGTAFGLSFAQADPDRDYDADTPEARRLRLHRTLRWVHLAIMAAQVVGGVIIANLGRMGVDERENWSVLQGLATYHLAMGTLGWGALTWAGALMML